MIYTAMFDEVNEGTAIFKVVTHKTGIPASAKLATLDDGNCNIESDGYLKLAGTVTKSLSRLKPEGIKLPNDNATGGLSNEEVNLVYKKILLRSADSSGSNPIQALKSLRVSLRSY